jgi:LmbE family N-acetylglucosaminyl deacetylase
MNSLRSERNEKDLGGSAIVFSPHQDDETLGCGGTIILKKRAGADVKIVFLTDGCSSHAHLMPEHELFALRAQEAIAAAGILGVEQRDVFFLEFPDGALDKRQDAATQKVTEILLKYRPQEVFIPYYKEPPSDHAIANRVVLSAIQQCGINPTVYEYPIWFWRHWPWTSVVGSGREKLLILKNTLLSGFGLSWLKEFRSAVYIGDVLEFKRAALNQHKSQMTRLIPNSNWQTLSDVSNGEFLDCFFQDFELFRQYRLPETYSIAPKQEALK